MKITKVQILKVAPAARPNVDRFLVPLNDAMLRAEIDTPLRVAAFMAQVLHESGSLLYVKELASGDEYEGRRDLGNTEPGDGMRFKGRGLIQVTGHNNYLACSKWMFGDDCLLGHPELLENAENAAMSAAWFWTTRKLNALADKEDQLHICKAVNGGLNGYAERQTLYSKLKVALGIDPAPPTTIPAS